MQVNSLRPDLLRYLKRRGLIKTFEKQLLLFKANPHHPSLHMERLEPASLKVYSFRINRKYRAIFLLQTPSETEIVDINDHYQ